MILSVPSGQFDAIKPRLKNSFINFIDPRQEIFSLSRAFEWVDYTTHRHDAHNSDDDAAEVKILMTHSLTVESNHNLALIVHITDNNNNNNINDHDFQ